MRISFTLLDIHGVDLSDTSVLAAPSDGSSGREQDEIRKVPQEEILEWIHIDCDEPVEEEITDELLIKSVLGPQSEPRPVESESDDEEVADDDPTPVPTWSEASATIDTFIRFAERSSSYNASELCDTILAAKNRIFRHFHMTLDSDSFEDSDSTEETDHPFTNYLYNIFFYVVGAVLVYVVGVYIFGVEVDNDLENM
ncbi:hypothetical protein J6590_106383 [Homalodisca vitripennis]|nr:hypothetical protein J6590_106383 [Homalodisca vitripennis]